MIVVQGGSMFVKAIQTRHIGRPHPGGGVKSAGIALGEKQLVVRYHASTYPAVGRSPGIPEDGISRLSLHHFRRLITDSSNAGHHLLNKIFAMFPFFV